MRQGIVCVLLIFVQFVVGQGKAMTKGLGNFTEIKVYDGLSVRLIKANENKAVITGEDGDKVALVNNGGVLKVRMQITRFFSGYKTFVDIYHNKDLLVIDVNEDAKILGTAIYEQKVLELKAKRVGKWILRPMWNKYS